MAINLATITDFNRLYQNSTDPYPIRLFDGNNKIEKYRLVPFNQRLEYKDVPNTACYDYANKIFYLNGTVNFAETLNIRYIRRTAAFTSASDPIWESRFNSICYCLSSPLAFIKAE